MQLIVLSAGKGSRLPPKYRKKPKCLVKVGSKPLILYNKSFFDRFYKKTIVTGFRQNYLKNFIKQNGFKNIINEKYATTNMVFSLFLARKQIDQDVVIVYGDIIFDDKIFNLLKEKKNLIPININWFKNWQKRMNFKNVLKDAENLFIENNKLIEIGTEIKKTRLPKYQFMGIIKLKKKSYFKCYDFFKKLKNKKIDMTTFLNLCIKNKIISINVKKYKSFWYEVDTKSDHKYASLEIKKW